jgi:hypothetical protein
MPSPSVIPEPHYDDFALSCLIAAQKAFDAGFQNFGNALCDVFKEEIDHHPAHHAKPCATIIPPSEE